MDIPDSWPTTLPASVAAVLAERHRQITRYGHTPEADDASPRNHLLRTAHVFLLDGSDILSRRPGPADLERARRKAIQSAALCLAEIERIDRELEPAVAPLHHQGVPRQ